MKRSVKDDKCRKRIKNTVSNLKKEKKKQFQCLFFQLLTHRSAEVVWGQSEGWEAQLLAHSGGNANKCRHKHSVEALILALSACVERDSGMCFLLDPYPRPAQNS